MRVLSWVLAAAALCARAAWGQGALTIQAESCFSGMAPAGVYPVVVSIRNQGPSVDGAIVARSDSFSESSRRYVYPVSLPSGTSKRIIVYPAVDRFAQGVLISFAGPARAREFELPIPPDYREGRQVGLIGDQIGGLGALRVSREDQSPGTGPAPGRPGVRATRRPRAGGAGAFNDCYARPEDAPDRAAGYGGLAALVLADGAERMSPAQWAAIRRWVTGGGSLVLLGGAGATYVRVPEAAPLVPLRDLRGVAVSGLRLPWALGRPLPGGDVSLLSGSPAPGSAALARQDGHILLAARQLGAGTVLYAAFNPLEKPLRGWEGQPQLWNELIRRASATVGASALRSAALQRQASFVRPPYGGSAGSPGARYRVTIQDRNAVDPFRVRLPPVSTIVWVFLAYFVLVVPLTYFVLRRLGRLEWAWVTSPLLSAAFAYGFYLFTADLYLAGLSRRTSGVVVASAGDGEAHFVGFSELFFPRGGSYKLEIPGAETLELSPAGEERYYGSSAPLQALETVDLGSVVAPDFRVANLAFRRVYHSQPVPWGGGVTAQIRRDAGGGLAGTVRNGTGQELFGVQVLLPGEAGWASLGDLKPGQTKSVGEMKRRRDGESNPARASRAVQQPRLLPLLLRARGADAPRSAAILFAQTQGAPFGPPLGRYVGGERSVSVLVSLPLTGGGR